MQLDLTPSTLLKIFSAVLAAVLAYTTFPPLYLTPIIFIAFVPLLTALKDTSWKQAFKIGLLFGIVYFALLLWWLVPTIARYGKIPIVFAWPIVGCLILYLAAYPAIWAALSSIIINNPRGNQSFRIALLNFIAITAIWVLLEWIRGHLLSGLPWGLAGCSLVGMPVFIQTASILGIYWLSFTVLSINLLLFKAINSIPDYRQLISWGAMAIACICILWIYGHIAITSTIKQDRTFPSINAAAIQGDIQQDTKWSQTYQQNSIDQYRRLTTSAINHIKIKDQLAHKKTIKKIPLIVWPETAMPFFFNVQGIKQAQILDLARASHSLLLVGSIAYKIAPVTNGQGFRVMYFNSAFLISPTGKIVGQYNKQHLVPFGEYLPWGILTSWARNLIGDIGAYTPGRQSNPLCWHNVKIGTLICFESIFPHIAVNFVNNGANVLAVITDDAWFGNTSAPYEHADMAVFRAVETRRWVIRAANTGESLIITPWGQKLKPTKLFKPCWITDKIRLRTDKTLYDRIQDQWLWILVVIVAYTISWSIRTKRE